MAQLIPENIQTLLSTFKFDLDDDCINEDLSCTICKKVLHDAYQSTCDCKYCRKCVLSYINNGNEYCPGGKEVCSEDLLVLDESVFPNGALNKKVLKVRVRCPNECCQFASTLAQMEDHLRVCSLQPIECPYIKIGCVNKKVNRDSVETHLNKDMLAHSQMLMEVVDNLKNEVGGLKGELRVNKLEITSLREEFKLKEREIREEERRMVQEESEPFVAVISDLQGEVAALRVQVKCAEENQQRLKKLEEEGMELRGHIENERQEWRKMIDENEALKKEVAIERKELKKMSSEVVALKKEMGTKIEESKKFRGEIESLKKEMENKREESRKMSGEIQALKKEADNEKEKSRKMTGEIVALKNEVGTKREESKKVKDEIEVLQRDMKRIDGDTRKKKKTEEVAGIIDRRVGELTKTVNSLSKWINKGDAVGSLWFKVDGLDELRKKGGTIFSPYLYSHINGYKLLIEVYVSSGVYLDAYSVICMDEYDDVLSWPARGLSVSVNIINHHTKEAYKTWTIKYDNNQCNKPIDKNNEPYGYIFNNYPLSDLDSTPGIIVSDSLLLLVTASPP